MLSLPWGVNFEFVFKGNLYNLNLFSFNISLTCSFYKAALNIPEVKKHSFLAAIHYIPFLFEHFYYLIFKKTSKCCYFT